MTEKPDMSAVLKAVADSPKRENSTYHKAMADARQIFAEAEEALGGPVTFKIKTKTKRNGKHIVKWTFKRAD
ncbi:hypothetical protein M0654_04145 [Rhizobium sp. NTR19]|uniref:Uncharacterized protein n=1 Tax=Neorhizobium turbinariae TaxID=2937795 RepID=A0ABT0IMR7_9HYPH|nr:hypothetical protein [Neorhizobium turbinariae]MCK8779170.1 hypothetical protein [Neorhizobium turbinariae]